MHDLCPLVYLIAPEVFTVQDVNIDVEISGELTLGRTVVDTRPQSVPGRHRVGVDMDVDRFWDIVIDPIAAIGTVTVP